MSSRSMTALFMSSVLPRHSLELWSSGPIYESVVRNLSLMVRIRLGLALKIIGCYFLLPQIHFNFLAVCKVVGNT